MRNINPYLRSNLTRPGIRGYLRKIRNTPRPDSENEYVLTIGGEATEEIKTMFQRDVMEENRDFQIEFCKAVEKGRPNGERLHRWELASRWLKPQKQP